MSDSIYCERVRERLPRFIDGELPELEEALDRGHMECCTSCAGERDELRLFLVDVREALAPSSTELEAELAALMPKLGAHKLRPVALRLLTKRVTLSLLTAAAAVLLLLVIDGGGESLQSLSSGNLFESLGVANWRLPLGEGSLGVK